MTLLELLIVIAIIGILAAIAISAFLGQREKSRFRAVEATARGALTEVAMVLEDYISGMPVVIAPTFEHRECNEYVNALPHKKCDQLYPALGAAGTYEDWGDVIGLLVEHFNKGREVASPYDGEPMFSLLPSPGHAFMVNSNDSSARLVAMTPEGAVIFNSVVAAH